MLEKTELIICEHLKFYKEAAFQCLTPALRPPGRAVPTGVHLSPRETVMDSHSKPSKQMNEPSARRQAGGISCILFSPYSEELVLEGCRGKVEG